MFQTGLNAVLGAGDILSGNYWPAEPARSGRHMISLMRRREARADLSAEWQRPAQLRAWAVASSLRLNKLRLTRSQHVLPLIPFSGMVVIHAANNIPKRPNMDMTKIEAIEIAMHFLRTNNYLAGVVEVATFLPARPPIRDKSVWSIVFENKMAPSSSL